MALPDPRSVAARLFRVTAFAARSDGYLSSMRQLANQLHEARPIEFRYNRLGQPHVVTADGIYEYASLARDIGLLTEAEDAIVPFTATHPPVENGFELALTERAVQYLEEREFTLDRVSKAVGSLLRKRPPVLPTWRQIHEHFEISISETKFNRLLSIEGVKQRLSFIIVSRRVLLPAGAIA